MATSADRPNTTSTTLRPAHLAAAAAIAARAPRLAVRPAALYLVTDPTGRASSHFLLLNEGHGLLNGTVVSRPPWLRLNVYRFVGNHLQVYTHVDPAHLTGDGEVTGTVIIESNGGTACVPVTCKVKMAAPREGQAARTKPRDRSLLRLVEPEIEGKAAPSPSSTPLHLIRRSRQLIMGALVAGVAGLMLLIGAIGGGSDGERTAEAAPFSSQPPSFSIGR